MSSVLNAVLTATRHIRGLNRAGPGLGVDELGSYYLDNSHDPADLSAGELYAAVGQTSKLRIGNSIVGTIGLLASTFVNRVAVMMLGSSQAPVALTCVVTAAAGTGATCTATGTDLSGTITFTPGSGAYATGVQFTVTLPTARSSAPQVFIGVAGTNAAGFYGKGGYVTTTTTGFSVGFTVAPSAAAVWTLSYMIVGI